MNNSGKHADKPPDDFTKQLEGLGVVQAEKWLDEGRFAGRKATKARAWIKEQKTLEERQRNSTNLDISNQHLELARAAGIRSWIAIGISLLSLFVAIIWG